MSQNSQVPQVQEKKELIITVSRYGQIVGNYRSFDSILPMLNDYLSKGLTFVVSANYIQ